MLYNDWLDRSPSKFQGHHINAILHNFFLDLNLTDPWRSANPLTQSFSWFKPDGSAKSRIDFWLISDIIMINNISANISAAPLTDHCLIQLQITPHLEKSNRGYWKFNSTLLTNANFNKEIIEKLDLIVKDVNIESYIEKWEYFKFKVRQISMKHSKLISNQHKQKETNY